MSELIKYLLLGLVQGLTEPLPISSSGHMIILESLLKFATPLSFKIITNFGSLIAIIIFYRKFIGELISDNYHYIFKKDKSKKNSFHYVLLVILATIPGAIMGYFLSDKIENKYSSLLPVGVSLAITGVLLLTIKEASKRATKNEVTNIDAVLMGIAQVLGLFPGISRSGSTTSVAVYNKVEIDKALRFSFMMYIPISLGSLVLGISDMNTAGFHISGFIGGFILSFLGTLFAIRFLIKIVHKDYFHYFGYYCLTVSIIILLFYLF